MPVHQVWLTEPGCPATHDEPVRVHARPVHDQAAERMAWTETDESFHVPINECRDCMWPLKQRPERDTRI